MLNRNIAPDIQHTSSFTPQPPIQTQTNSGVPCFLIDGGDEDIIRLEIIFDAGTRRETKSFVASSTSSMLMEGTRNYNSKEIATLLDTYGAYIYPTCSKDSASIVLICLSRHLDKMLPLLNDITFFPSFPEDELMLHKQKEQHKLLIELEKTGSLVRYHFPSFIYGPGHPYGKTPTPEAYIVLQKKDLQKFHKQYYQQGNLRVLIAGKNTSHTLAQINSLLDLPAPHDQLLPVKWDMQAPSFQQKKIIHKPDTTQDAIRMGMQTINRYHPDYTALYMSNLWLGGFFGSRLMKTIREEKGLTYGIYSTLVPLQYSGYFVIHAEITKGAANQVQEAATQELVKLQTTVIKDNELTRLKNFAMGEMLRSFDGPFETGAMYRSIIDSQLPLSYYEKAIKTISDTTAESIKQMAKKHLPVENIRTLIVGEYQ